MARQVTGSTAADERGEILDRIVGQALEQVHGGDVRAGGGGQQRVAVGRGAGDQVPEPIVPLAPARFSTTMVWPSASPTLPPTSLRDEIERPRRKRHHDGDRLRRRPDCGCARAVAGKMDIAARTTIERRRRSIDESSTIAPALDTKRACASRGSWSRPSIASSEWKRWSKSACSSARQLRGDRRSAPGGEAAPWRARRRRGPASSNSSIGARQAPASPASAGQSACDEADAHRLVGLEAFARDEIAAQVARTDRAQEESE